MEFNKRSTTIAPVTTGTTTPNFPEVATQEEPEDQKTYRIDFDDLDIPKDYVIDQVFCGDNITVYALFEVLDDASTTTNEQKLEHSNPKSQDNYRYLRRNSSSQKKLNGFHKGIKIMDSEESELNRLPNKVNTNGSFYCLKHLGGDYGMLTPERENSDLKVLYSKSTVPRSSKSRFKAVSKGVNTDIVQSPKIIQEVQKAVKQNTAFCKPEDKSNIIRSPPSKPSYEVIEMEMRQSFSSVSTYTGSRKQSKNSIPNFFLVPLLMMEDGVLSHFQNCSKDAKTNRPETTEKTEEKTEETEIVPKCAVEDQVKTGGQVESNERVSMGTNTDLLMVTPLETELKYDGHATEITEVQISSRESRNEQKYESPKKEKEENLKSSPKSPKKVAILNEIKKLQGKLNALIESIETDSFELDSSENEIPERENLNVVSPSDNVEVSSETTMKTYKTNSNESEEFPVNTTSVFPVIPAKKNSSDIPPETEHSEDVRIAPAKSFSLGYISGGGSYTSQIMRSLSITNCDKSKEELKKTASDCSIIWSELENRKGAGLSKSTTNTHQSLADPKLNFINGIKKSHSFDLKDVKVEVMCLKKIKNYSFKLEKKTDIRIPQKGEPIIKREMGDEPLNKPKSSKIDLISLSKAFEKAEDMELEKFNLDPMKNLKVEEGDAKFETAYSKEELLSQMIPKCSLKSEDVEVHFCNINSFPRPPVNRETNDKSLPPNSGKPKAVSVPVDIEPLKIIMDLEKPTTPNRSSRKQVPPSNNLKKDVKTPKKANIPLGKVKIADRTAKAEGKDVPGFHETTKLRSVTGSRKFTLKATAVSKLHVDRLIKADNPNNPKYDNSNNSKTENSKVMGTEKTGPKASRSPGHKREPTESPVGVLCVEGKEYIEEVIPNSSYLLNKKGMSETKSAEKIREDYAEAIETSSSSPDIASNQSGVVVELLSEKPKSIEALRTADNEKIKSHLKPVNDGDIAETNDSVQSVTDDPVNPEKPVVKSVWALTKVLLFEDGSKKIEVLEASLTPPGYSLPKSQPNDDTTL